MVYKYIFVPGVNLKSFIVITYIYLDALHKMEILNFSL